MIHLRHSIPNFVVRIFFIRIFFIGIFSPESSLSESSEKFFYIISNILIISIFFFMLIASTKCRSVRGASHQPAFMSSCLTISHACLPCLPSGIVSASVPGVV